MAWPTVFIQTVVCAYDTLESIELLYYASGFTILIVVVSFEALTFDESWLARCSASACEFVYVLPAHLGIGLFETMLLTIMVVLLDYGGPLSLRL